MNLEDLHLAARHANWTFNEARLRGELQHLTAPFWGALADLQLVTDGTEGREGIIGAFKAAHQHIGPAEAFGSGTPCGDALRRLHDAYSHWLDVQRNGPKQKKVCAKD